MRVIRAGSNDFRHYTSIWGNPNFRETNVKEVGRGLGRIRNNEVVAAHGEGWKEEISFRANMNEKGSHQKRIRSMKGLVKLSI